jgi:zinc protease
MLDGAGADVESHITPETVELTAKCLSRDLPMVLELLVEQWRMPVFKAEEFAKAKIDLLSSLQQSMEDTGEQAAIAFSRAARAEGDPLRRATIQDLSAAAKKATLAMVKAFHANRYSPRGMQIVVAGDVDAEAVQKQVAKLFEGWQPKPEPDSASVAVAKLTAPKVTVPMADKTSVSVLLGQPAGLQARDADWLALRLGNDVLGFGFTSRLVGNVRDREGLTYHIGSVVSDDARHPGMWSVKASFAPSMLERGEASMRREVEQWWKEGITADELTFRKTAMAGEFTVGLETTTGLAEQILQCVRRGFELKWLDEYPAKLDALTLEQVNRVIRAQLDPKRMVLVEAGLPKETPPAAKK